MQQKVNHTGNGGSYIEKVNHVHEKVNHTWKGESFCKRWIIQWISWIRDIKRSKIHEKVNRYRKRWIIHLKGESFKNLWIIHEKGESFSKRWIIQEYVTFSSFDLPFHDKVIHTWKSESVSGICSCIIRKPESLSCKIHLFLKRWIMPWKGESYLKRWNFFLISVIHRFSGVSLSKRWVIHKKWIMHLFMYDPPFQVWIIPEKVNHAWRGHSFMKRLLTFC